MSRVRQKPAQITVAVLNGTGGTESGLASTYADALEADNFKIGVVTDATDTFTESIVMYSNGNQAEAKKVYEKEKIAIGTLPERIRHVVQACFNGKRIVVFSGGATKGEEGIFEEARAIRDGGGNGSIIGRNTFQRPREDALKLLDTLVKIYQGKE